MIFQNKYLISLFMLVACCLQQCCWAQSTTVRPYKFGFTIDEQQHRSESRDERGIVMGEFGFITADGIYHVTVYATDEQGRFRILAMRNYPYESPPKTVEVMVQPKITPTTTTTTTAKPLPRHNFNNEACSGCFLTNGNNKPKGLNGVEDKSVKSDIRPLSKSLPSPGSNAATKPNIANKNTATGKLSGLNGDNVLLTFNANKNAIKLNTPVSETLAFNDFVALQNAVKNQQIFSTTTPSTFAPSKIDSTFAPNTINTKPSAFSAHKVDTTLPAFATSVSTLALNKFVTKPSGLAAKVATHEVDSTHSTFAPKITTLAPTKFVTTPSTLTPKVAAPNVATHGVDSTHSTFAPKVTTYAPNIIHTKPATFATPQKYATNVANEPSKHYIPNKENNGNFLNNKNKSDTKTLQKPLQTQQQISKHIPQHNAPLNKHQYQVVALSMSSDKDNKSLFTDKNKAIINNVLNPLKTKPIQFLKHDLPTKTAAQENTLPKIPSKDTLEPPFEGNLNTDTIAQGNTLTQTPQKPIIGSDVKEPSVQEGKETSLKHVLERPSEAKFLPQAANPATLNKISGKQPIQTPLNTNTLNKQYTTSPTFSKDTNQRSLKPLSGSPGGAGGATAKSNTGNPPPIMDIIMQKVLPAIMGKTGPAASATPTQSTTLNKPNAVPSGKKPSGSSGSSSANGDGDLYRFKYILDYHGHTETGKRNGDKEGSYYSIGDDNVERTIEYVANEFGYQPRIRWRKLDANEIKSKENTLKDYEFVWFNQ